MTQPSARERATGGTAMTMHLSRRELLTAGGAALAALSVGRAAHGQAPKSGSTFVSAQTTDARGLDPQLVPAFSRRRRSPMMYNQLVRFDAEVNPVAGLAGRWYGAPGWPIWNFR